MSSNITRIGDNNYLYKDLKGNKYEVQVDKRMRTDLRYKVVELITQSFSQNTMQEMTKQGEVIYSINYQDKKFLLHLKPDKSQFSNLASKVHSFIKNTEISGLIKLKIEMEDLSEVDEILDPECSSIDNSPEVINIELESVKEYSPKPLPVEKANIDSIISNGFFQDSYTLLSTECMQHLENNFNQKDLPSVSNLFCITTENNHLVLKHIENSSANSNSETVKKYREYLVRCFGENKINYIEHLYGIDLRSMEANKEPLLTDIIYKINIGLGNIEKQDIDDLLKSLETLKEKVDNANTTATILKKTSLMDFCKSDEALTLMTLRGLNLAISKDPATPVSVQDFIEWYENSSLEKASSVKDLDSKTFNQLVSVISFKREERENQYTGRKIENFIKSPYTVGGTELFKPWVDQQELLQTFSNIEDYYSGEKNSTSNLNYMSYYAEVLAHVVCKKSLIRSHPTEEFRVGALIPAPPDPKTGLQQWYVVTNFFNNGQGNVSYTLESATKDSSLPKIKLMRSTASDTYQMDGKASVLSDLNPMSSPGYLGKNILDPYEKEWFEEISRPIWCGYLEEADTAFKQSSEPLSFIQHQLEAANDELLDNFTKHEKLAGLKDLIAEETHIFFEISKKLGIRSKYTNNFYTSLLPILGKYSSNSIINNEEQHQDAKTILEIITALAKKDVELLKKTESLKMRLIEFLNSVKGQEFSSKTRNFLNETYPILQENKKILNELMKNPLLNKEQIDLTITKWLNDLNEIKKTLNEEDSTKENKSLLIIGHSLGASLAQRYFSEQSLLKGRIPLKNQTLTVYAFDAPGIEEKENEELMKIGEKHKDLLNRLDRPLIINEYFESGDFVPGGGQIHLGAAKSEQTSSNASKWGRFNIAVNATLSKVASEVVGKSSTAHATQFLSAERQSYQTLIKDIEPSFQVTWLSTHDLYRYDKSMSDIKQQKANALFNTSFLTRKVVSGLGYIIGMGVLAEGIKLFEPAEKSNQKLHGDWLSFRDNEGAFVVNVDKGIISSKKENPDSPKIQ